MSRLRKLYGQIILGATPTELGGQPVFIKHFGPLDQGELDGEYDKFLEYGLKKGLYSEKAKLELLAKDGLWTEAEENALEDAEIYLLRLRETKKNLPLPSQVESVNKDIEQAEIDYKKKSAEKLELIGYTAEIYAQKQINELYVSRSFFKDKECKIPLLDGGDDEQLEQLVATYNNTMADFNDSAVRKIALASFFQTMLGLANDSIFEFYGKPIVQLSFYQAELFNWGRSFKHILADNPPPQLLDDPDKLVDWYNTNKNAQNLVNNQDSSNVVIMGTQEDVQAIASSPEEIGSISKVAGEKKVLRGAEFLNILK